MMDKWRLLDTGALPGTLNMGIDLALLHLHARGESPPTLRFYQWDPRAVSLGYFQDRSVMNLSACRAMDLDVVRRPTGGRAVLHDKDLTYSVIAGAEQGIPTTLAAAYELLCEGLISGFERLGFRAERGRENAPSPETEVCFVRFAVGDILYDGKKFVGNAQTWKGRSMLQHGSIVLDPLWESWVRLMAREKDSPESLRRELLTRTTCLKEILGRQVEPQEVKAALTAGLAAALGVQFRQDELSSEEWTLARDLASKESIQHEEKRLEGPDRCAAFRDRVFHQRHRADARFCHPRGEKHGGRQVLPGPAPAPVGGYPSLSFVVPFEPVGPASLAQLGVGGPFHQELFWRKLAESALGTLWGLGCRSVHCMDHRYVVRLSESPLFCPRREKFLEYRRRTYPEARQVQMMHVSNTGKDWEKWC